MLLERRTVSRKTANDGRLEITKIAAAKIGEPGDDLSLDLDGARHQARLGTMECTCRGPDKPHVHYFIESEVLKGLPAGRDVELALDAVERSIHVSTVE